MPKVTPLSSTEVKQSLSNPKVKAAMAEGKVFILRDGGGLHLRIRPNKSRSWGLDYVQPYTKKRVSISFGTYPTVSLASAREQRQNAKRLLDKNIDPKKHREELERKEVLSTNNTFEAVMLTWFELKKTKVKANTANGIFRKLDKYILPELGKRPIKEISAPEVIEILKPVAASGILETNTKIIRYLNEIMTHAVNAGIIDHNSLAGIKSVFETPKTKHVPTIRPEELPKFMKALSLSRAKLVTRLLIEWQLHTMVRPGEAAKARWSEIDFVKELWNVPAETMKKNRDHTVPLTEQTLKILESIRPISGHREFIFPGDTNPNRHANESTANNAIKGMGYHGILVAHGMRSIASTAQNEQGFDFDVVEAALAHLIKDKVRRAYNRADYLIPRTVMMAWWSNYIEHASTGNLSLASTLNELKLVNSN
jgi:integrase